MTRLSNWKEESDLFEVVTGKMTDEKALKKVDEKKGIKNKVIINPKLTEAIKNIGGELISIKEQEEEENTAEENTAEEQISGQNEDLNSASADNLRVLENIDVKLTVQVGAAELKIRELLRLNEGSVIELDRLAGDPLDILINGTMIAKGEVVMVGERFGIRFSEIVDPQKRIESVK